MAPTPAVLAPPAAVAVAGRRCVAWRRGRWSIGRRRSCLLHGFVGCACAWLRCPFACGRVTGIWQNRARGLLRWTLYAGSGTGAGFAATTGS